MVLVFVFTALRSVRFKSGENKLPQPSEEQGRAVCNIEPRRAFVCVRVVVQIAIETGFAKELDVLIMGLSFFHARVAREN